MVALHETLEETPPELAGDIATHGVLLAGGGALLHAFAERVQAETGMRAYLADSPLTCVAVGAGHALEELDILARSGGQRRR
jgi:rod shape-determining protein MreB